MELTLRIRICGMADEYYGATSSSERAVSHLLDLPFTGKEQDWEIEFSDSDRIEVMLELLKNADFYLEEKSALCPLTITSFEGAVDCDGFRDDLVLRAIEIVSGDHELLSRMRYYWLTIGRATNPLLVRRILSIEKD